MKMRRVLSILAILKVCLAGHIQIQLPNGQEMDEEHESFNSESLENFNRKVLGIDSGSAGISGSSLFTKPRALVVISINGLDDFNYDGHIANFTDSLNTRQIRQSLHDQFGDKMIHVELNSSGIFAPDNFIKRSVVDAKEDERRDIENMFNLAKAIKEKDRKAANVVDYYRIHLDVSNAKNEMEKRQLEKNAKYGLDAMKEALGNAYDGHALVEIISHGKNDAESERRAEVDRMKAIWKQYQVTRPRHADYPATAAIFMFVVLGLLFTTLAAVFMMFDDGDMGKNSIVYRLSSGRQKKD